jgi:hypothetical protein
MLRLAATAAATVIAALAGAAGAGATTYYVSSSGDDAAAGTAATAAWRSVARVNSAGLAPGDAVRFEGGQSFSGLLSPPASGREGAPILLTSYGSGRANLTSGISLASRSWLTLRDLKVDTGAWRTAGSTRGVMTASSGTGVQHLVIEDCAFVNVAMGLLIQNRLDRFWTVRRNTIQYTRDSGILIYDPTKADEVGGSDMLFESNQLLDNGIDTTIAYKKHAVYDIGTDLTWRNNTVRRFSEGAFSLRARGNTLEGNTISDGPYGIYHSAYDGTPGTTRIAYNKISNVTGAAIELNSAGKTANVESFVIANNTIHPSASAPGIRVIGTAGSVTVANNLVTTVSGYAVRIDRLPAGGYTEKHNLVHSTAGAQAWAWLGAGYSSLSTYQAASGRGAGSIAADPKLDARLTPLATSPAVDSGSTSVASLTYRSACGGNAYEYCGQSVDIGGVESGLGTPAPPLPSTSPEPAPLGAPTTLVAQEIAQDGLTLTWTASGDPRVVGYRVLRDGTLVGTSTMPSFRVTGLSCSNAYQLTVRSVDAQGATSTAAALSASTAACPVITTPDVTPPAFAITSPKHNQSVAGSLVAAVTASDDRGVAEVIFLLDGKQICRDVAAPYTCAMRPSKGWHTIYARAQDTSGNRTDGKVAVRIT